MPKSKSAVALLATLLVIGSNPLAVLAQTQRSPIVVEHSGKDSVGQRLAFELREVIRASQSMRLVTAREASPRIVIYLITIENNQAVPGTATTAAMTIAYDSDASAALGNLLTTVVQNCGTKRTQECARDLAADIDQELEKLRKDWPTMWGRLGRP
jgi:hypothetical protein